MEFKKVLRGYDPKQVDKYIADNVEKETSTRRAQKERIDELLEENYNLRDRIAELQLKQNDVADALLTAQTVAREMEQNAKDVADKALFEAKKFYATWQAYSKTIVATFSDDELAAFLTLEGKIGDVIAEYERKLKGEENPDGDKTSKPKTTAKKRKTTAEDFVKQMEKAAEDLTAESNEMTAAKAKKEPKSPNPITRVEQASGQTIDLRELLRPEQSLEDLCADLGLIDTDTDADTESADEVDGVDVAESADGE